MKECFLMAAKQFKWLAGQADIIFCSASDRDFPENFGLKASISIFRLNVPYFSFVTQQFKAIFGI